MLSVYKSSIRQVLLCLYIENLVEWGQGGFPPRTSLRPNDHGRSECFPNRWRLATFVEASDSGGAAKHSDLYSIHAKHK
jgi:hypothetical protein